MQKKKKLCFLCLCLCVGLTACSTTAAESRDRSAVLETKQDIPQEDILAESPEETIPQEDESIELFNSQGVYMQILAEEDVELSEADRAEFLAAFGFEDSEPFYVHTEEDGYPFMELYYDEEREIGCGIRYGENASGNVICGFAFDHCLEVSWHKRDPFSVLSVYGTTGESGVTDYQENYEYDEEGRLLSFQSTGTPIDMEGEEWKNIPMITVNFFYDDLGRLREKLYSHSTIPYLPFDGTTYSSQASHYDERGRLAHTDSYITHGGLEGYYIYQGDDDVPAYYLELDIMGTHSAPTLYRFVNRNNNWEFGGFRRSTEAQYQTYEIEPGEEEDFLLKQGFTEKDLYYEYEYAWDNGTVFRLSLYCDQYVTRGTGLIRRYWEGEYVDLEIFSFDGCEQYLDDAAVGQYSVYSEYSSVGRMTHFLDGETIDEYFGALELDGIYSVSFDYEDGKLAHMYEGRDHGSVDRFYFYKAYDHSYRCGPCMLEVDHGWGVTFYRF